MKQQCGIALIEALISLLIIAISCAGSLYVVSRANAVKTQTSLQDIAVQQLRNKLMNHGNVDLCAAPGTVNIPGVEAAVAVNVVSGCGAPDNAVLVDGVAVAAFDSRMVLTVNHADVGGLITVGGS